MLIDEDRLTLDEYVTDILKENLTPLQISTHKKIKNPAFAEYDVRRVVQ